MPFPIVLYNNRKFVMRLANAKTASQHILWQSMVVSNRKIKALPR